MCIKHFVSGLELLSSEPEPSSEEEFIGLSIYCETEDGDFLYPTIVYNVGGGDHKLMPIIKDIIGTHCPFADTSKFQDKFISSIHITQDEIAFDYHHRDEDDCSGTNISLSVDLDDIRDALHADVFSVGIYLKNTDTDSAEDADNDFVEAYDIQFDEDFAVSINIANEDGTEEICVMEGIF